MTRKIKYTRPYIPGEQERWSGTVRLRIDGQIGVGYFQRWLVHTLGRSEDWSVHWSDLCREWNQYIYSRKHLGAYTPEQFLSFVWHAHINDVVVVSWAPESAE